MRLLTAGSLVRAQHGEPKKKVHAKHGLSSLFSIWFRYLRPCVSADASAVNWLECCRRLWRREAAPEQEKTRSEAPATRASHDYVFDRRGRWFEPNTGSQSAVRESGRFCFAQIGENRALRKHSCGVFLARGPQGEPNTGSQQKGYRFCDGLFVFLCLPKINHRLSELVNRK